jgi:hypothetical protein
MIVFIWRDTTQQSNAASTILFNAVMEANYPTYCFDVLECKKTFRQQVLSTILDHPTLFLVVPLVDGTTISFEGQLISLIEYYGEYAYGSGDSFLKKIKTKTIRSFSCLKIL